MYDSDALHCKYHCVKSVQIRSFSGPYFLVFSPNTGKYGSEKALYLDTFHAVYMALHWGILTIPNAYDRDFC